MPEAPTLKFTLTPGIFPVLHSILSPPELLATLAAEYPIGGLHTCTLIRSGLNDTYLIQSTDRDYVLRVYRAGWRGLPDIQWELALLVHLTSRGIAVSSPVPRRDGALLSVVQAPEGLRYVVLFTYAPGELLQWDSRDNFHRAGRATGELHATADDFACAHERFHLDLHHLLDRPLRAIQPRIAHRPQDSAYLMDLAERLHTGIAALAQKGLDWGACHGDLVSGNIHCRDSGVLTFFDFDCSGFSWRAYELATAMLLAAFVNNDAGLRWQSFLDGYTEVRGLGREDIEAVPLFTAARLIWSMGVQADGAEKWGLHKLDASFWDSRLSFLRRWESAPVPV